MGEGVNLDSGPFSVILLQIYDLNMKRGNLSEKPLISPIREVGVFGTRLMTKKT